MTNRAYEWVDAAKIAGAREASMSGRQFLELIRDGKIPEAPIFKTMDFHLLEVGDGQVVFRSRPQSFHYNPIGTVHGGYYATLLDSCMSCAVHTRCDAGTTYTTLEFKTHIVRGLSEKDGEVRAEGRVVHAGRRIATSEGRIVDANGRLYAHGTATCLMMPI